MCYVVGWVQYVLCYGMCAICVMLWDVCNMCYVMEYMLCIHSIYIYAMLWDMCNAVGLIWLRCIVLLLFVFVIVAVKAFMAQLQCPRQISLNGTIKFIVSYQGIWRCQNKSGLWCRGSLCHFC